MSVIVGIDEVGRGCWAGPLVAGAVVLARPISGLRDSKKLSKHQREKLAAEIRVQATGIGLGWVEPAEVDELGLTASVRLAMQRALEEITVLYEELVIDGAYNFFPADPRARALVRADDLIPAVSAASIVAKVARDAFMVDQAKVFPQYAFDKHVGYGTALHKSRLQEFGTCKLHRLSYRPVAAVRATMQA